MPVAHQPLAAVIGELVGMAADQGGNLRLDGLRQQRSRAVAQHLGQRIGECSWLGELENISLCHGVSLLRWRSGSFEHPHDTPPYPFMPSPTFVDSSGGCALKDSRVSCLLITLSSSSAPASLSRSINPISGRICSWVSSRSCSDVWAGTERVAAERRRLVMDQPSLRTETR